MKKYNTMLWCGLLSLVLASQAHAQMVVTFQDNGPFDDLFPGNSVDLSSFNNGGSPFDATFNLVSTSTGQDLNVAANGRLGIANGAGSSNSFFNVGENMVFDFGTPMENGRIILEEFRFQLQDTDGTEKFTLSSSGFDGRGYEEVWANDTNNAISFNESTDTFTFTNTTGSSTVTYSLIADGALPVSVLELEDVTLGYLDTNGSGSAGFIGFTVHAVPEPAFLSFLSAAALGLAFYVRRKKHSA